MTTTESGSMIMRTRTSGFLLALLLAFSAHGQTPSTSTAGAQAGPGPTAYVIKFKVKAGKNAAFEKAIGEMMAGVRQKEPGNVYCNLFHLVQDPQTYVVIERFGDAAASKAHGESEHIKKLGDALKNDLLDAPPDRQELVFIRAK